MYEKLAKLFYKMNTNDYNHEFEKRKNGYGSYVTPLTVKTFRKGKVMNETYPLFFVNTHDLMILNNMVLTNSSNISSLVSKLPVFAVDPYFHKLIINDAQSNNEIEGIQSTKKELHDALNDIVQSEKAHKRFNGLMKTYLFMNEIDPFTKTADFRKLYDDLVAEEIEKTLAPDGVLFRKGYVEINDGQRTTHIGVHSEMKINEALHSLLHFLGDDNYPELYRYMVAHYYYEYIHPFYDGNGRTGRLLVCSYLSRYLERYSATTFSYAVNKNKAKYYKALEEIPSPSNKGEMTFYLMDMLELLIEGQKEIIGDLELNLSKVERIEDFFQHDDWPKRKEEVIFLRIMLELSVFVHKEFRFPVAFLMDLSSRSRYKVNQIMDNLEKEGYVQLVSQRPKKYIIADTFLVKVFRM